MKEAFYCQNLGDKLQCLLCPHECVLAVGNLGICQNRQNVKGKLISLAYGNPCALHVDPIEKKPLYHFYPYAKTLSIGFAGCNLRCLNCQNASISQKRPDQTKTIRLLPDELVNEAIALKSKIISFTYTEPLTAYEYILEAAKLAKSKGLKTVLVSAGYINEKPLKKLLPYIDAANIDLKSLNSLVYKRLSGVKMEFVLRNLKLFKEQTHLEITHLIVPGYCDKLEEIMKVVNFLVMNGYSDIPIHFSRFFPAHKMENESPTSLEFMEKTREIAVNSGLNYVYLGNVRDNQSYISYCPNCKTELLNRAYGGIANLNCDLGTCKKCGEIITGVWK